MFLLHINHVSKISSIDTLHIKKLNSLKKRLINKIVFIKTNQLSNVFDNHLQRKKLQNKEKFIEYIIGITLCNSNVNLYISNIKGQILYCYSSGELGLSGKQKTKKPNVLIKLIKHVLIKLKMTNCSSVGIHFKQFSTSNVLPVFSILNNHFWIQFIKFLNSKPHNGCRPRKLKRKKRRFLRF